MEGSSITNFRRLAWNETDAAGHNHFSAVMRWVEETEHLLYTALGLDLGFIDRVPRVSLRVDYHRRLYFAQVLAVRLRVEKVGRSSCAFTFEVLDPDGQRAIAGEYVIVHVHSTDAGSAEWPEDIRAALTRGTHVEVRDVIETTEASS